MDLIFHQMWTAWVFRVQGQVLGLLAQSPGPRESATLQPEPTQERTSRARVHVGVRVRVWSAWDLCLLWGWGETIVLVI